ncbi:MAG: DUF1016 N-terminal domain-containing protein [Thiohalocapsa sp.]|nr:DUF1016 N-terminal domain-containing protein [Thiohalocapsa sp.]
MSAEFSKSAPLFEDIQSLIDSARQRATVAVNAELTLLYWQVGQRIQTEVLRGERAEYGKQVIAGLAERLTATYGKGWSRKQLHHCLRFAETFPDRQIVSALRRQLSWTHIKALIYIEDPLKRDFYTQMAQLEGWSIRTLSERIRKIGNYETRKMRERRVEASVWIEFFRAFRVFRSSNKMCD